MGCAGSRSLSEVAPTATKPTSVYKPENGQTGKITRFQSPSNSKKEIDLVDPNRKSNGHVSTSASADSGDANPSGEDDVVVDRIMMRKFSIRHNMRKTQSVKMLTQEAPEVQQSEFWRSAVRVLDAEYLSSITNSSNYRDSSVTVADSSSFSSDDAGKSDIDLNELDWDFDPFTRSPDWLLEAAMAIFRTERSFVISDETMYAFLSTVRLNYHENPFHNWYHAFSVLQAAWMLLRAREVAHSLTALDRLAVLLAAVCHDIDHPGVNNDFLSKAGHTIAAHYPPPHLENHHAAMTLRILADENRRFDILASLSEADRAYVVRIAVAGIAATDMGQHKPIVEELRLRVGLLAGAPPPGAPPANPAARGSRRPYDINSEKDRKELVEIVLHAADLSAQAFCPATAYNFGRRVLAEFHAQYVEELRLAVAPSGFMKDLDKPLQQAKTQLGYLNYVLLPLWEGLCALCPELQPRLDAVEQRIAEIDFDAPEDWAGLAADLQPPSSEDLLLLPAKTPLQERERKRMSVGSIEIASRRRNSVSAPLIHTRTPSPTSIAGSTERGLPSIDGEGEEGSGDDEGLDEEGSGGGGGDGGDGGDGEGGGGLLAESNFVTLKRPAASSGAGRPGPGAGGPATVI